MSWAAATVASQHSALVSSALKSSDLSTAWYPISLVAFAECILAQTPSALTLSVVCFETYVDTSPTDRVVRATLGLLGHQYNIATVLLPDSRATHIRVDYGDDPPSNARRLSLVLDDDHDVLSAGAKLVSRVARVPSAGRDCLPGVACTPTLAALASLFGVAHAQLGSRSYGLFGRNCYWISDMLFYCMARRYSEYWLAGSLTPEQPLRRYLLGELDVLDAVAPCVTVKEMLWWWARWGSAMGRIIEAFFRWETLGRVMTHDDEVAEWIRVWAQHSRAGEDS